MLKISKLCPKVLKKCVERILHGRQLEMSSDDARKKWVIEELSKIPKGKSILDAGAGECKYKPFCKHLNYVSQDFCEYKGKVTEKGYGVSTEKWDTSSIDIVSDITDIPVKDKSFDYILCSEVFEHISYPDKALLEFNRILKDDGILILTAPFASMTHFAPYHFATGFNVFWYEQHCKDFGFEIIKLQKNGNYYSSLAEELLTMKRFEEYEKDKWLQFVMRLTISQLVKKAYSQEETHSDVKCTGIYIVAKKIKNSK